MGNLGYGSNNMNSNDKGGLFHSPTLGDDGKNSNAGIHGVTHLGIGEKSHQHHGHWSMTSPAID
jgi:hypothetical protein